MGSIPDRARRGVRLTKSGAMAKGRPVRLVWFGALALGAAANFGSASQTALADGYAAPRMAQCATTSPLSVSENGACFALDGKLGGAVYPEDQQIGDISLDPTSLSASGAVDMGAARLGAALQMAEDPGTLALDQSAGATAVPGGSPARWNATPVLPEIDHAYVDAGTDRAFMRVGKVAESVAATADDTPFSSLDLFDSRAALGAGVQTSAAASLGGQSLQLVSDMGGGSTLGTALEGLSDTATAVASWNYTAGAASGHVTVLDPDVLAESGHKLGVLAGTTIKAAFLKLRGALAGDRTGWWNGLVSTEAEVGRLTLAASGEYLRNSTLAGAPQQFGGGFSASVKLDDVVAVDGSLDWVRDDSQPTNPDGYQVGLGVTADLSKSLKVSSKIGVSTATADSAVSLPYGETQIAWRPEGGTAVSAGFGRDEDGGYRFTTAAKNNFN